MTTYRTKAVRLAYAEFVESNSIEKNPSFLIRKFSQNG